MRPELLAAENVIDGRYKLVRELGEGGMGWVWEATHVFTGKSYALKFLKRSDEADRRRFEREARAVAAIDHPNVVAVHDFVVLTNGMLVMVMDLLSGESLGALLGRTGALELSVLAAILLPVTTALEAAHARGIVHRDLKPDNIFVVDEANGRRIKVLDFGTAKLLPMEGRSAESRSLTATGAIIGTPYYMAPEQVLAEEDVDARVDVWALGVILYEALTGARPSEADTVGKVLKRILSGDFVTIREKRPDLPPEVSELVSEMLDVDRTKRPSLETVRERLAPHAAERVSLPPRVVAAVRELGRAASDPHGTTQQASALSVVGKPGRSIRWPWLLAATLVAIAVGVGTWTHRSSFVDVSRVEAGAASAHPCDALPPAKLDAKRLARMQLVKPRVGSCFWIDQTEVTVEEWSRFRAETGDGGAVSAATGCPAGHVLSEPRADGDACGAALTTEPYAWLPNKPMRCVDWCDARAFCLWAGKDLCASPNKLLYSAGGVDSDALVDEWGTACSSTGEAFPYGRTYVEGRCNNGLCAYGRINLCVSSTVLSYSDCRGATDTHDMVGNVAEWVLACAPARADGERLCAQRGGSYRDPAASASCLSDNHFAVQSTRSPDVGFRCCAPVTTEERILVR